MKRVLRLAIIPIALAGIVLSFSCSDSEHRIPFLSTRVMILMNLPDEKPDSEVGIIERIRRFLVPDALAQSAPATFSSIKVRVTGPDMAMIEKSFAPYSSISMSVPAGSFRNFEVIAYVAPGDPSAALSFRGTASANCPAGSTVSVPVVMGLHETKIIIPDPFENGYTSNPLLDVPRIIQINDMTGAGWIEKHADDIGFTGTFQPWDVDFDSRGRIYIANNNGVSGSDVIIRIDNISDTECVLIGNGSNNGIVSVAMDRSRNQVYYANSISDSLLQRCNLDGTNDITLPKTGTETIYGITGLDIASDSTLYISGSISGPSPRIFRYDTVSQEVTASYSTYLGSSNYLDVKVRGSYVYVANPDGEDGYKVLQLSADLQFVAGYGSQVFTQNTNPGMFYGPQRFVGIRNDALIVIDELTTEDIDKLVSLNDITGAGWTTYGTTGKGIGQFQFFYGC